MSTTYKDTDLVYINPALKQVVSKVEFNIDGNVIPLEIKEEEKKDKDGNIIKARKPRGKKRYYPWGSYATMKKLYRIEGKQKETEDYIQLDEAIEKAVEQPYW
ncbi:MAG: hypothetical protein KAS32_16055 [Candidatus Peribacteraceae bacterium]|nr:hypothetical protein [Candidatus Peribacteraceae bacterium]